MIRMMGDMFLLRSGLGWVNSLGFRAGPRLQVSTLSISKQLSACTGCSGHTHTLNCV